MIIEVYGFNDMIRVIRFKFIVVFVCRNRVALRQLVFRD